MQEAYYTLVYYEEGCPALREDNAGSWDSRGQDGNTFAN